MKIRRARPKVPFRARRRSSRSPSRSRSRSRSRSSSRSRSPSRSSSRSSSPGSSPGSSLRSGISARTPPPPRPPPPRPHTERGFPGDTPDDIPADDIPDDETTDNDEENFAQPPDIEWIDSGHVEDTIDIARKVSAVKTTDPPMICGGKPFDLRSPPPEYYTDLEKLVAPVFAERRKIVASGGTVCTSGKKTLAPHQIICYETIRSMLSHGMREMGGCRGLLCWHGTGSGKTILAASILMAAKLAERFHGKKYDVCIVTTRDNAQNNSPSEYAQNILETFPHLMGLVGLSPPEHGADIKSWAAASGDALSKHLKVYTTTTKNFADLHFTNDRVVIIDEFQNLIAPRARDMQYRDNADKICRKILENMGRTYVFPLTATPAAGKISNFAQMANFIRPLGTPEFTESSPPASYAGLISYVDTREDRSMFGELVGTGNFHDRVKNVSVAMGHRYCFAFLQSVTEDAVEYDPGLASDVFMKKLTEKSSVLAASDAKKADIDMDLMEREKRVVRITASNRQMLLSNKLMTVISKITSLPGKQFVFAANPTISKCIEAALLQHHGFSRVGTRDIPRQPPKGSSRASPITMAPAPRYMCYGTGKRDAFPPHTPEDQFDRKHLWGMRKIMDDPANLDGQLCKIMVAMGSNFEGLNIKAWRGVHIVQPLSTKDADEQAIGRALRACGHAMLPPNKRNAVVARYFSVVPPGFDPETVLPASSRGADKKVRAAEEGILLLSKAGLRPGRTSANAVVFEDAQERQQTLDRFEACVKRHAIDCKLLTGPLSYGYTCGDCTTTTKGGGADVTRIPQPRIAEHHEKARVHSHRPDEKTTTTKVHDGFAEEDEVQKLFHRPAAAAAAHHHRPATPERHRRSPTTTTTTPAHHRRRVDLRPRSKSKSPSKKYAFHERPTEEGFVSWVLRLAFGRKAIKFM